MKVISVPLIVCRSCSQIKILPKGIADSKDIGGTKMWIENPAIIAGIVAGVVLCGYCVVKCRRSRKSTLTANHRSTSSTELSDFVHHDEDSFDDEFFDSLDKVEANQVEEGSSESLYVNAPT